MIWLLLAPVVGLLYWWIFQTIEPQRVIKNKPRLKYIRPGVYKPVLPPLPQRSNCDFVLSSRPTIVDSNLRVILNEIHTQNRENKKAEKDKILERDRETFYLGFEAWCLDNNLDKNDTKNMFKMIKVLEDHLATKK